MLALWMRLIFLDLHQDFGHRRKPYGLDIPSNAIRRKMGIVVVGRLFPVGDVNHDVEIMTLARGAGYLYKQKF